MSDTTPVDMGEVKPLTDWKNEPTIRDLKTDLTESKQHHDAKVSQISEWLDNLNVSGKAKVKVGNGQSSVQPRLIRKQAEWRYAALSEPFLSVENVFKIKPVTWADTKSARQNQILLNNQFNTKVKKTAFIDELIRTAVDEGTVTVRVGWNFEEEEYEVEVPEIEYVVNPEVGPLHEQLAQLRQESPQRYEQEVSEELKQAHELTLEHGQPIEPQPTGRTTIETRTRTLHNHPTLEICDYRNLVIDPSCEGDLDKAGFIIYSFESSLSALEKDGKYTNLDKINLANASILGDPDHASQHHDTKTFNFSDKPRKKFVVHEYWGYWDIDGTGRVRPFVAAWVGDTLIRMEESPFPDGKLPYVSIQYLPVRRDSYGEPDGALLEDNQKIVGAVTRGMIDIMGKSANGQTGIRKDFLDTTNRRKFENGQDYEYNQHVDPRMGVFMHTFPEIPASAQFMLANEHQDAESMSGVKAYSGGLSGDALGKVATGVRGVLDAASKREIGILRRFIEGMTTIGRKIIAMNAVFLTEEEVIRVTDDEFVTVMRDDLAGNFDITLGITTAEEDNARAEELSFMLQTLGPNEDPGLRKLILAEIARLRKMPDLAKRIEDYEPQPDPMAERRAELELATLQAELEHKQAETQKLLVDAGLSNAKTITEGAKAQQLASDADLKDLDFIEQESGVKQERDLQKHGAQAKAQAQLKLLDHAFKQREKSEVA